MKRTRVTNAFSLNPYYTGSYSMSIMSMNIFSSLQVVLILIILEVTL